MKSTLQSIYQRDYYRLVKTIRDQPEATPEKAATGQIGHSNYLATLLYLSAGNASPLAIFKIQEGNDFLMRSMWEPTMVLWRQEFWVDMKATAE
ncbi:hypothetical protein N7520_008376 [Penicillium odoratum]|uniref:uncharacterized protein n=1 Tax=Penicillium odoratum TaxID=1167516 RepID=UPI0025470876|nr:uncharacterized protein N7520_008376 [Penicillium odoratum]KAJ5761220.1 hypothetical protein N7520_008376 [Penicillium odoratum]